MRPRARLALLTTIGLGAITVAPITRADDRPVSLIKMPYRGERNLADLSDSPDYLEKGGLRSSSNSRVSGSGRLRPSP